MPPRAPSGGYDVAIVGGGPAGTTVASHLARAGLSVLLCDAAFFPRHKTCGEYLPPAALGCFDRLGVLDGVERLGPRRHVGMAVVSPDGTEVLGRYDAGAPYGLALRRYDLDRVLLEHVRTSGAAVLEGWRAVDLERRPDGLFDLALRPAAPRPPDDTRRPPGDPSRPPLAHVLARAIVGADGRNSIVARRLGLRRREPHRRWAVMGHFRGVRTPDDHGEMIVTPYGYCGINPLPRGLANVCIVVDPRALGGSLPGRAGLESVFRRRIEEHPRTRARMAEAVLEGGLRATGPMACRAARGVADGALLVGDAAGFFDPFTGEGIAMALRGGEFAAEILAGALRRGGPTAAALAPYERLRRGAFAARLRLDRILQAILARPRLADRIAAKLRRDPRLADLLARVTGDTADAGALFRPAFLARLLRA